MNDQHGLDIALRHITLSTVGLVDGMRKEAFVVNKGRRRVFDLGAEAGQGIGIHEQPGHTGPDEHTGDEVGNHMGLAQKTQGQSDGKDQEQGTDDGAHGRVQMHGDFSRWKRPQLAQSGQKRKHQLITTVKVMRLADSAGWQTQRPGTSTRHGKQQQETRVVETVQQDRGCETAGAVLE